MSQTLGSRSSKFLQWINYRVRVDIQERRYLVGTLIAFDKHMNLVLKDCEEFRTVKIPKAKQAEAGRKDREIKRMLGLVILRGENIITVSAVAPPG